MELASIHIKQLKLLLIHNDNREVIDCNIDNYTANHLKDEPEKEYSGMVHLSHKIEEEELDVRFCWCFGGKMTPKNLGSVNLLGVNSGKTQSRD